MLGEGGDVERAGRAVDCAVHGDDHGDDSDGLTVIDLTHVRLILMNAPVARYRLRTSPERTPCMCVRRLVKVAGQR